VKNFIKLSNQKCSILKFKIIQILIIFNFQKYSNCKKLTERKEPKKEKRLPDAVGLGPSSLVGPAVHHNCFVSGSWARPNNSRRVCGSSLDIDQVGVKHLPLAMPPCSKKKKKLAMPPPLEISYAICQQPTPSISSSNASNKCACR
jgi:hypothetical protein